jgi:hypothetical protein
MVVGDESSKYMRPKVGINASLVDRVVIYTKPLI